MVQIWSAIYRSSQTENIEAPQYADCSPSLHSPTAPPANRRPLPVRVVPMSSAASTAAVQQPLQPTLKALYTINKRAKQLARAAETTTRADWLNTVSTDTLRKDALYEVKRLVLRELQDEASCTELHEIRGTEFYCFYFGQWSFHTPVEGYGTTLDVDGRQRLPDFNPTHSAVRTQLSVEDALAHFADEYDINANDYLPQRHVAQEFGEFVDAGWDVLDD